MNPHAPRTTHHALLALLVWLCGLAATARAVEYMGDISVSAQAMHSGETHHGYSEVRVTLENRSPTQAHEVTLTAPNSAWNSGNTLRSITRRVTLAPGARAVVPLWQPPLPANGDNNLRVQVRGEEAKPLLRWPNGGQHMNNSHGRHSGSPATVLVSRNLDHEVFDKVMQPVNEAFQAVKATGAPDSSGGSRYQQNSWMPDSRVHGVTNWLELDYDTPVPVEKIRIHTTASMPLQPGAAIFLIDAAGVTMATASGLGTIVGYPSWSPSPVPIGAIPPSSGDAFVLESDFSSNRTPVKTIRLEFNRTVPVHEITIDAVERISLTGSTWAVAARASSDNSARASTYGASSGPQFNSLRAELPVAEWSENWLAYTPYDGIAISSSELKTLPPAVATAVWSYVAAGGNIFICGADAAMPATVTAKTVRTGNDFTELETGLGHCFLIRAENIAALQAPTHAILRNALLSAARYWDSLPDNSNDANSRFPVVGNVALPMRSIVVLMLVFVVAIGPVNVILLARRNRRTWMLWTIPAISFVTCLIVFVFSLLHEGVTGTSRLRSFTLLDQANHRAVTVGTAGFYCPLTPSAGLRFDYGTEVTPLVEPAEGRGGSGTSRDVDWTQAQQFRRGWVAARVPAHFHLRKVETRRERLQIEREGNGLVVINGLGGTVRNLWVADASGQIFRAATIPAGQKAALTAADKRTLPSADFAAARLFRAIGYSAQGDALNEANNYLAPNTYLAELDEENPFLENALAAAGTKPHARASAVVYGLLEPVAP